MFKHLLIPLDGSALAEAALPAAVQFAQRNAAAVTLLHIIEQNAPTTVHGERHLRNVGEAKAYLDEVAKRVFPAGITVSRHVHEAQTRDVARGIAEHRAELAHDTVVMTSHGHGGLKGMLFGRIAEQVVAIGRTPILLIRPRESGHASFECRRVLIPHDGVPAHETGLTAGTELARIFRAEAKIIMVVPTRGTLGGAQSFTGTVLPRATRAVLELAQEEAIQHIRDHAAEMQRLGITAAAEVLRGEPARKIVEAGESFRADVIVLGTHGRAGTQAFWQKSIAPRIAGRAECSILFVPASATTTGADRESAPTP